jgi:hypothetical protein
MLTNGFSSLQTISLLGFHPISFPLTFPPNGLAFISRSTELNPQRRHRSPKPAILGSSPRCPVSYLVL